MSDNVKLATVASFVRVMKPRARYALGERATLFELSVGLDKLSVLDEGLLPPRSTIYDPSFLFTSCNSVVSKAKTVVQAGTSFL